MALSKQIYLYSIDTDFLYTPEERNIHNKLSRLYIIRKKYAANQYCKQFLNKIIKKYKQELSDLLDANTNKDLVRQLDTTLLTDKRVIGLFDSSLTRALNLSINQVTIELFVLNVYFFQILHDVIKNGFMYNGEKYVFFTASAGQIRTKKCVCIKESSYERIRNTLMCGLSVDKINAAGGINPNKYLSYLALSNSATDVWDDFDIDKAIVVDDFETDVFGTVDFIDDSTYEITRQEMDVPVPHMDGAGIMLDNPTRMIRGPWLKGLLIYFPFDKFIKEKCSDEDCVVTDIWGQSYHIIADGIKYILTKSQMKLWKYYSSWSEYKEYFKKYHCEICYCNIEEEHIPKSRINYQMLQTLTDMRNDEIDRLIKPTVKEIESIGNDYKSTMRILGATDFNQAPSYFQQALQIYPELFKDKYCRSVLKDTKKSLVKKAKSGKLKVNGEYLFISPDLYAFCEWLFLGIKNPQGLLQNGEVYTKQFGNDSELACLRSPHLYKEWAIRRNVKNNETEKWFGDTKCLYTSCHDLISKILQ